MSRVILISIFLIVSLVACTYAQESLSCRENEEFYPCGTCDSRCFLEINCLRTMCTETNKGSCGCKSGYVRNDQHKCIHRSECDSSIFKLGK